MTLGNRRLLTTLPQYPQSPSLPSCSFFGMYILSTIQSRAILKMEPWEGHLDGVHDWTLLKPLCTHLMGCWEVYSPRSCSRQACREAPQLLKPGLPRWLSGKESACQSGRRRFSSWVGKVLWRRQGQCSPVTCLENPMDRGAWRATVHGVAKLDTPKHSTVATSLGVSLFLSSLRALWGGWGTRLWTNTMLVTEKKDNNPSLFSQNRRAK